MSLHWSATGNTKLKNQKLIEDCKVKIFFSRIFNWTKKVVFLNITKNQKTNPPIKYICNLHTHKKNSDIVMYYLWMAQILIYVPSSTQEQTSIVYRDSYTNFKCTEKSKKISTHSRCRGWDDKINGVKAEEVMASMVSIF